MRAPGGAFNTFPPDTRKPYSGRRKATLMSGTEVAGVSLLNDQTPNSGLEWKTLAGSRLSVPGSLRQRLRTKSKSSGLKR